MQPALFSGWARTSPSAAYPLRPTSEAELLAALSSADDRGCLPRGLGRAYGDAAQNAGGILLDMSAFDPPPEISPEGVATVGGGTSLDRLMRHALPRGWFVPVTPGTRQVTIGGAVAADIHGKNHHVDGSFANHVQAMRLLSPSGAWDLHPSDELFWATTGGMGLTGAVTEVRIQMVPVETSRMLVDTDRTQDLDETLAVMTESDHRYRYTVSWIDCVSRGARLGRSVLTRGDHAPLAALEDPKRPLTFDPRPPLPAPPWAPGGLLNPLTIRIFNELWYQKSPRRERQALQDIGQYFHPLDGIAGWNRLYGVQGFLQYQVLIPFGHEEVLRRIIERLAGEHCPSFLGVLKRFGPANAGPLSFPGLGWTLALDMPTGIPGLGELLDQLDNWVADTGGRTYLAKDSRVRPDVFRRMYPRLEEWRTVRDQADPEHRLQSDLSRRLGLTA